MPPEPATPPDAASIIPPLHPPATPTQHGLDDDDDEGASGLPLHPQGEPASGPGHSTPLSTATPRNRIDEYERALLKSARKTDGHGPLFEVVKSARKPDGHRSPIADLPNEILIHAIAHLSPNDLAAVALVSRRFNDLVTTPHAWQVAFARFFPGALALEDGMGDDEGETVRSEKRTFARLTPVPSWRSEYIMRTRLLRSLARGKPVQVPAVPRGQPAPPPPIIMYNANTFTTINHLHATWGSGLNKREPRFIHGADDVGMVTASDPTTGRVDPWGQSDPNFYAQFSERFPGTAQWGLGSGEVIGCPNVMDVSQPNGMIYGQGCPEGSCYFRAPDEPRGRVVAEPTDFSLPEAGIPKLGVNGGAICAVWIAKSDTIPKLSDGMVGMMTGSAAGVVSVCSLGTDGLRHSRLARGELTARWVLSPGIPIIALAVDEQFSAKRHAEHRIWAVALNALGELFYLTQFPIHSTTTPPNEEYANEFTAWLSGRSVSWTLVEPSRRTARPDPYSDADVDGSYSPRSSSDGLGLSAQQLAAETKDISVFLRRQPKDFRKACLRWDMRRRLEVDFAGDDGNGGGEAAVVFECGLGEGETAEITRFTRWRVDKEKSSATTRTPTPSIPQTSLFGGAVGADTTPASRASSPELPMFEEWRVSRLSLAGFKSSQLTTTALDNSSLSTITHAEDPALSTLSTPPSPSTSPFFKASRPASSADIPGQRARFLAAGTKSGVILLWDVRAPVSRHTTTIPPLRIIATDSPEIASLALTSLFLLHGGNDGLVQAWDPLASSTAPLRTLNSRFSSRARRRLAQAAASAHGVGINMFAASAIALDPDASLLRGAVALGNQVRFWAYSSSADAFKNAKRRLRRGERANNGAAERFAPPRGSSNGKLKGWIEHEQAELEREESEQARAREHLAGRFGTEMLEENEALALAALLSQESLEAETKARLDKPVAPENGAADVDGDVDPDIAEAIRLSLLTSPDPSASAIPGPDASPFLDHYDDNGENNFNIPIKFKRRKGGGVSPTKLSALRSSAPSASGSRSRGEEELADLEFALRLSLAEEESRQDRAENGEEEEFPALTPVGGVKGKGRAW